MRLLSTEKKCNDCNGSGWYWGEDDWQYPCETCNGTGKVNKREPARDYK